MVDMRAKDITSRTYLITCQHYCLGKSSHLAMVILPLDTHIALGLSLRPTYVVEPVMNTLPNKLPSGFLSGRVVSQLRGECIPALRTYIGFDKMQLMGLRRFLQYQQQISMFPLDDSGEES